MATIRHDKQRCRGVALLEMCIVIILLMVLLLGVIEYSWLFLNAQKITNAARHGARLAVPAGADIPTAEFEMTALLDGMTTTRADLTEAGSGTEDDPYVINANIVAPTTDLLLINAPGLIPVPANLRATVVMAREGN